MFSALINLTTTAILLTISFSTTQASVITKRQTESDTNVCQTQGSGMCTLSVSASLTSNGLPGGTVGGSGEVLFDNNCNYITSANNVGPKSPGFSGTLNGNGLSQPLYFGADTIGLSDISGISFQYNGQSYTQKDNCDCGSDNHGLEAGTVCRCPFACPN